MKGTRVVTEQRCLECRELLRGLAIEWHNEVGITETYEARIIRMLMVTVDGLVSSVLGDPPVKMSESLMQEVDQLVNEIKQAAEEEEDNGKETIER